MWLAWPKLPGGRLSTRTLHSDALYDPAQASKRASDAAAEAEGTRDGEGAYDPSTWAPPTASGEVDVPIICSLLPDPSK